MRLVKTSALLCMLAGCQTPSSHAADDESPEVSARFQYHLVTPETKGWDSSLSPDLPLIEKAVLCPVILQSFLRLADEESDMCQRSFDKSIGFENIEWNYIKNSDISDQLIYDIVRTQISSPRPSHWTDEIEAQRTQESQQFYKTLLSSNRKVVSQSSFDLDNDGVADMVYRIEMKECDPTTFDGTYITRPIEPFYVSVNEDGSLKNLLSYGPVAIDGVLFRYHGKTFISRSASNYIPGGGKHIAVHPIFPKRGGSSNVFASAFCIIEESR